jgi:hypothetical protein
MPYAPDDLPTFAEIAHQRIADAGPRDKTISIKVAINTARMMVERETAAEIEEALKFMREMRALAVDNKFSAELIGLRVRYALTARFFIER